MKAPSILLVANYDSNVGYAWWLMESFWAEIARRYVPNARITLAYPSVSRIPGAIAGAPIQICTQDMATSRWSSVIGQLRFLRSHGVTVMYITDGAPLSWRYLVFRVAGVRTIVVHDHTPGQRTVPTGVRRWLKRQVHRLPGVTVDGLIGVSDYVHRRHVDAICFPPDRCYVAPNGLPEREVPGAVDVHARFGIPVERQILVSVGRAHQIKGIDTILEAMEELIHRDKRRDVHYLHCGDGPHAAGFADKAAALGLSEFVTFAPHQPDIPGVLRGCGLAIHASTAEVGYSLSILEFMEAGLPLIVSEHPSVSAATEDDVTGVLMRTADATSAAAAIRRLLDSPRVAARMGAAARKHVREHFTLQRTHRALLAALDEIFSAKGALSRSGD